MTIAGWLSVDPRELPALAVEVVHGFFHGVEDDPISAQGAAGPFPNAFDLGVAEILEIIVVSGGRFVLSHDVPFLV
jgi:hypothetical protein